MHIAWYQFACKTTKYTENEAKFVVGFVMPINKAKHEKLLAKLSPYLSRGWNCTLMTADGNLYFSSHSPLSTSHTETHQSLDALSNL